MRLKEGQIYQGGAPASGDIGAKHQWIIVAPFGDAYAHSIDNPLDLHCLPEPIALHAVTAGYWRRIESTPDHPVIELQRAKEHWGIRDMHQGLRGEDMKNMLLLCERAVKSHYAYAPYAAGEILALVNTELYGQPQLNRLIKRIRELVHLMGYYTGREALIRR